MSTINCIAWEPSDPLLYKESVEWEESGYQGYTKLTLATSYYTKLTQTASAQLHIEQRWP